MAIHCLPNVQVRSHLGIRLAVTWHPLTRTYTCSLFGRDSKLYGTGDTYREARHDLFNQIAEVEQEDEPHDRLAARWDHARDYRKHSS